MDNSDLIILSSTEIIKDKLYFATLEGKYKPKSTKNSKYFHIEDEFVYENFYHDFGPYHLCHLYFFCQKLNTKLAKAPSNKKIVFYTSDVSVLRLNAAYLIGSYAIIYLKKSPSQAHAMLAVGSGSRGAWQLLNFRDASGGPPLFEISLLDVLQGVHRAHEAGFFRFDSFNHHEYQYYEKVVNGDLNWIMPGKMLAFSGPHAVSQIKDGYPLHAPEHYHKYFRDNHVTTIVRLNKKSYNSKQFTDYGFEHFELFFIDGSAPSDAIVNRFIKICEFAEGAVAVHCKAGLGRTGTLIACYMMKHYAFTAKQAIAWLRICRPGSVIGHQQRFLENIQARMLADGESHRRRHSINAIPKCKFGIYSLAAPTSSSDAEDLENANVPLGVVNNTTADDDDENVPKQAVCRLVKLDNDIHSSPVKQNNDDYVSLDTIINANNNPPSMETRSVNQQKVRATSALATAKTTYTSNKNNYIMSTANCNNKTTNLVKVSTTYSPKKMQTSTTNIITAKTQTFTSAKSSSMSPIKSSLTKSPKAALHSQRANLARNHGQGYAFNHGASPLKTYLRKGSGVVNDKVNDAVESSGNSTTSITTLTESCSLNSKNYDANLNVTCESARKPQICNTNSLPAKLGEGSRKKMVTRASSIIRKKAQKTTVANQNQDFRIDNANVSNSDSERDSTTTTLTNISADSLENIPCKMKMATRREKSCSPEPMDQSMDNIRDNIDEGVNSQGTKLYKIKAKRLNLQVFSPKKEGVQTRSFSTSPPGSKKK